MSDDHDAMLDDDGGAIRWDAVLLAGGFDVDPDAVLVGRAADEAAAASSDTPGDTSDPWANASFEIASLTDEQRHYVDATSPALGAELPTQSLTGGDPFDGLTDESVSRADDDIIDFD